MRTTPPRRTRRAMVERLWAEGKDPYEIARAMGWNPNTPPTTQIAIYRARGWNLPHRMDEKKVAAIKAGRWPGKR